MDILDVNDFTSQLQKSVKDNLMPEIIKVNDLTKEFKNSVIEGNWSVAIDLVGSGKVKEINTELTSSSAYFEKIKSETVIINDKLKSANGISAQKNIIDDKQLELSQRIANARDLIKESNEQTIPLIQAQIQQEQTKLSLLNLNDSNYASQLDTVKQLEDSLEQENLRTANLIGQQQALTNLKDVELQKMREILGSAGQMSAIYTKLGQYNADLIKSSEQNLKVNKDLRDVMSEMGDGKKELIAGAKDIMDEYSSGLDNIQNGIQGVLDKIPLVGGMLNAMVKGPLDEAVSVAKLGLAQSFLDATKNAGGLAAGTVAIKAGFSGMATGLASVGKAMLGMLVNPIFLALAAFGAFVALLATAYSELGKIQDAGEDFRKTLGASASDTLRIRDAMANVQKEYKLFGIGIEEAKEAAIALGEEFASHQFIQEDTIATVALLGKTFGIAADTSARAIDTMLKLGSKTASDATKNIMKMQGMASRYGLSFAKIMDDVANASESSMLFAKGNAENLAKAAVEARKMGTTLDEMAGAADRLLDFESSINAQMAASTMLGRNINLNRLRQLAMEGDAEKMAKEQLNILKQQGGLRNMLRWQQQSLAEALGMELNTLYKMESTERQREERQKNLEILRQAGNKNAIAELEKIEQAKKKAEEAKNETALQTLERTLEENRKLEDQKKIQDKINKAMFDLKTQMIPVVESLMPTFVALTKLLPPLFSLIGTTLEIVTMPFTFIAGIIEQITNLFSDTTDEIGNATEQTSLLASIFDGFGSSVKTIFGLIVGGFLMFKAFGGIFSSLFGIIGKGLIGLVGGAQKLVGFIDGVFKALSPSKIKNVLGGMKDGLIKVGTTFKDSLGKAFTALKPSNIKDTLGGLKTAMSGVGGSLKDSLKNAFTALKPSNLKDSLGKLKGKLQTIFNKTPTPGGDDTKKLEDASKKITGSSDDVTKSGSKSKKSSSMIKNFNKLDTKKLIQAAGAMVILAGALWVTAKAFQEFAKVDWKNAWPGFLALGALVLSAKALEKGSMSMIKGAAAIALLGVALIPAAFAFQMFGDVSWKDVMFGGVALGVLAAAAFGLSLIAVPVAIGAGVLALLGASLIPLAFALNLTAPALQEFGKIFLGFASIMVGALKLVIDGLVSFAKIVGGVIVSGFKALSDIIKAVGDSIIGIVTGIGSAISGVIDSISGGIVNVINAISGAVTSLVTDIERLGAIDGSNLSSVAKGLTQIGGAMVALGSGKAIDGAGTFLGAMFHSGAELLTGKEIQSPIDQIMSITQQLGSIDLDMDMLDALSKINLAGIVTGISEDFGDKASMASDGLTDIFESFNKLKPAALTIMDKASVGINRLLGGMTRSLPKLNVSDARKLGGIADALEDFFDSIDEINPSKLKELPLVGDGIGSLTTGFVGLDSVPSNIADVLENIGDGLDDFFSGIEDVESQTVKLLPQIQVGLQPFIASISTLPLSSISEDISGILNNTGDGIYQFFDELAPIDLTALPFLVDIQTGMLPFISALSATNIPKDDLSSILNNIGDGIFQFFDELAPIDLTALPHLANIQASMIPLLTAFSQIKLPKDMDSILKDLGNGIEEFADYVNDGEADKIKEFFKDAGSSFPKFVESMGKLASVSGVSIVGELKQLTEISNSINTENVTKLQTFTSGVVDALNAFAGIQDPAVEALSAITSELYMLCDVVDKLDVNKLGGLQNINLGGVQTPIKIPPRALPPSDPFLEGNVTEGTLPPKFMVTESPSLADVFAQKPSNTPIQETTETGTKSLADVFSNPVETKTQAKETNFGLSDYETFKTNLIESMNKTGSKSLDGYMETLKSYIELNKQLINDGKKPGGSGLNVNKFKAENAYMQTMMREIEIEKAEEKKYQEQSAQNIKFSNDTSDLHKIDDIRKILETAAQKDGGIIQLKDQLKIADVLGESYTDLTIKTRDDLEVKLGKQFELRDVNHQTNELIMKMLNEKEAKLFGAPQDIIPTPDIVDSTSTIPIQPTLPVPDEQPEISILENKKLKDEKNMTGVVQPVFEFLGNMYNKYMPESIKDKLSDYAKNEYFNTDEDHSMETHMRTMGVTETNTKDFLGDLGIMSADDKFGMNSHGEKLTSSMQMEQVVQASSWMDQIMSGLLNKKIQGKLYAEGQLVGMNTDAGSKLITKDDGTTSVSKYHDVTIKDLSDKLTSSVSERIKITDHAIKTGTTTDSEFLNEVIAARKQFLVDEGRLVQNKIQNVDVESTIPSVPVIDPQILPSYDIVDSTSTIPLMQPLQLPTTEQSQFTIDTTEPINEQIQQTESQTTNTVFAKIGDFAKNILPDTDLFGTKPDSEESFGTNIELSGLDTISVKGHNIFVEEIAKIVDSKSGTTTEADKKENNTQVVKKLDELILLMRKGGIAVNMDGRKVSRAVASVNDQ